MAVASANTVQMIDFYLNKNLLRMQLAKHEESIESIAWANEDLELFTLSIDGQLLKWNMSTC